MNVFDYIIGGLLLLMAVFLVVAIMLQSGKGKGLSGTIAGGSSVPISARIRAKRATRFCRG